MVQQVGYFQSYIKQNELLDSKKHAIGALFMWLRMKLLDEKLSSEKLNAANIAEVNCELLRRIHKRLK